MTNITYGVSPDMVNTHAFNKYIAQNQLNSMENDLG